jgi:hypothetical protein
MAAIERRYNFEPLPVCRRPSPGSLLAPATFSHRATISFEIDSSSM